MPSDGEAAGSLPSAAFGGSARSVVILGVAVEFCTRIDALERINRVGDEPGAATVLFANAHTLRLSWRDEALRASLRKADLVLNDGIGVAIAALMRAYRPMDNLNGTDLTPLILKQCAELGRTVYLLGGRPGVADEARRVLQERIPRLSIVGATHGYHPPNEQEDIVRQIRSTHADVLVIGMGNPRQELWLRDNIQATGVRLALGVGAFLDFSAGSAARAPGWVRKSRLEWVYRLMREPRRLWRRYLLGGPEFVALAAMTARRDRKMSETLRRGEDLGKASGG